MEENTKDDGNAPDTIYVAEIGSRLEWVQALRRKAIEEIDKDNNWFDDEGRAIAMTGMLRDYEKQELTKAKMKQDDENAKDDRAIAKRAIEIISDIRRREREEGDLLRTEDGTKVPEVEQDKLPKTGDSVATSQKSFVEKQWKEFELDMIKKGLDPLRRWDEATGQVVSNRKDD